MRLLARITTGRNPLAKATKKLEFRIITNAQIHIDAILTINYACQVMRDKDVGKRQIKPYVTSGSIVGWIRIVLLTSRSLS